jgi:hypothetical protein
MSISVNEQVAGHTVTVRPAARADSGQRHAICQCGWQSRIGSTEQVMPEIRTHLEAALAATPRCRRDHVPSAVGVSRAHAAPAWSTGCPSRPVLLDGHKVDTLRARQGEEPREVVGQFWRPEGRTSGVNAGGIRVRGLGSSAPEPTIRHVAETRAEGAGERLVRTAPLYVKSLR